MTIPQDPWFTVMQIAQNTYAISEYGHWEKVHSKTSAFHFKYKKGVSVYENTFLSFIYSNYNLY